MINIFSCLITYLLINFSNLTYTTVDGNNITMNNYAGKKIMLVNIATNSDNIGQLTQLKQLQQQFADSLVIILFPSNSFGKENRTNAEIKAFCQNNYNFTFKIASKSNVTGSNTNAVYKWLSKKAHNGDIDIIIGNDFQKFIISKNGEIMGEFSSKVSPLDPKIATVINTSF